MAALAERMAPGRGTIFLMSDVCELAQEMHSMFAESGAFDEAPVELLDDEGWLLEQARPFPIQTERERQAARRGLPVWRCMLTRNGNAADPLD